MKRGLIEWDRGELPPAALEARQGRCRSLLAQRGLDGLVLYTDVWRSGQACYLVNFIPYWNLAVLLLPREGEPILVTGLSNRVYPWIRETSALATIVSGNPVGAEAAAQVRRLEWKRVGIGERDRIPRGLLVQLAEGLPDCELTDATELLDALRDATDAADAALYRKARALADEGWAEVAPALLGKSGWRAAGMLEGSLRRRGATDVVVLLAPGGDGRWPAYPTAETLTASGVVVLSVEYKGHWVEVGQPMAGPEGHGARAFRAAFAHLAASLRPAADVEALRREAARRAALSDVTLLLSAGHRSFPFTPVASLAGLPRGTAVALHLTGLDARGVRRWWAETLRFDGAGLTPLRPEAQP